MKISHLLFVICLGSSIVSCKKNVPPPLATTLGITDITDTSAVLSYEVTGIEATGKAFSMGITWGESPNLNTYERAVSAVDGNFTMQIGKLKPHTTYYAKAFVSTIDNGLIDSFYGNEMQFFTDSSAVFIINHNGTNIYVYPSSVKATWHPYDFQFMGATSDDDGAANTILVSPKSYVAQLCAELDAYGFSDWYLPAINELQFLYLHRNSIAPNDSSVYWSSTEMDYSSIKALDFKNGNQLSLTKHSQVSCRCIRK